MITLAVADPVCRVPRAVITDLVEALGFAPDDVCRLEITPRIVSVTTFRLDESGHRFAVDGTRPATVTTEIRIE